MTGRVIALVARKRPLHELDEDAERRAYWASRSMSERLEEVEHLRRMWIAQTGDPDVPIARAIQRRRLRDL